MKIRSNPWEGTGGVSDKNSKEPLAENAHEKKDHQY